MEKSVAAASQRLLERFRSDSRRLWMPTEAPFKSPPPHECGRKAEFISARGSPTDTFQNMEIADGFLLKLKRPDLICRMREAVAELDRAKSFQKNMFCSVFNSCKDRDQKLVSEHSQVYFVCPSQLNYARKFVKKHATPLCKSGGLTKNMLPGNLRKQGDDNILCQLAKYIIQGMVNQVLPMFNMGVQECIVQEFFVNRQRTGAYTNPHNHPDDMFGGIFYLDAPEGTKFCYDNECNAREKKQWSRFASQFTKSIGPDCFSGGYAEAQPGDILLAPVNWLRHWVPTIDVENQTRVSIVFNMICLPNSTVNMEENTERNR